MGIIKSIFYQQNKLARKLVSDSTGVMAYYHLVNDSQLPHISKLYKFKSIAQFKTDLDFLMSRFRPADPAELIESGGAVTPGSFIISFDDGLAQLFSYIRPILNERGIKAILFLNTRYIDNRELMYKHIISLIIDHVERKNLNYDLAEIRSKNPEQTEELHALCTELGIDIEKYIEEEKPYLSSHQLSVLVEDGHYLGGHTHSHFPLHRMSSAKQIEEIEAPFHWLKQNLGYHSNFHSFPFTDKFIQDDVLQELYQRNPDLILMGNSGKRRDAFPGIIQRVSLENPDLETEKQIYSQLAYRQILGKYL